MANAPFHTTTSTSVLTNFGSAFSDDNPGADTLIVDDGAYLISTSATGNGAVLGATGAWTATINGSVYGANGIQLMAGNTGVSTISVGATGSVASGPQGPSVGYGIAVESSATIKNAGSIAGASVGIAILSGATHTIINSGTITGTTAAIEDLSGFAGSKDSVTNTGQIVGHVVLAKNDDTLSNTGANAEIDGYVDLGEGNNILTNSGFIGDGTLSVVAGSGADQVTNSGEMDGGMSLGDGADVLKNSGTISFQVDAGGGSDTIVNSGSMTDFLLLGEGNNVVRNSGTLGSNLTALTAGAGADTITNSGALHSDVSLGGGNDMFTDFVTDAKTLVTTSGLIDSTNPVDLGAGNDTFIGGALREKVSDGNGVDNIKLGGGNDTYFATGATAAHDVDESNPLVRSDTIDGGGGGKDEYDATTATGALQINLDIVSHTDAFSGSLTISANTASGAGVAEFNGRDLITNFEYAYGGSQGDIIYGSGAVNALLGNGGDDDLFGLAGNDFLNGGQGVDYLVGGAGADMLTGGADADVFWYFKGDSGVTAATRDVITDFEVGTDTINLHDLSAGTLNYLNGDSHNTAAAGFTGAGHELRSYWVAGGEVFELDVNGDKKADMSLKINDATHALHITVSSFVA